MLDVGPLAALKGRIGEEIAISDWLAVTQERINAFAEATGDNQWIHVDPLRAAASPLKTTIAHGFLTLSLVSVLLRSTIAFPPQRMAINYGVNRVRFITPVPAGARIRARIAPRDVEDVEGGVQVTWNITIEREDAEKPCAVVEWIVRYYPVETTEGTEGTVSTKRNGGTETNGDS